MLGRIFLRFHIAPFDCEDAIAEIGAPATLAVLVLTGAKRLMPGLGGEIRRPDILGGPRLCIQGCRCRWCRNGWGHESPETTAIYTNVLGPAELEIAVWTWDR